MQSGHTCVHWEGDAGGYKVSYDHRTGKSNANCNSDPKMEELRLHRGQERGPFPASRDSEIETQCRETATKPDIIKDNRRGEEEENLI